MKIHCIGDSLTEGWGLAPGAAWPELLGYVNCGWRGTTASSYLEPWTESPAARIHQTETPDRTIVFLGSNDAFAWTSHFKEDYKALVQSLPNPLLVIPPEFGFPSRGLEKVCADIASVAVELDLPVVDLYNESSRSWLCGDGVHLNETGQKETARLIQEKLEDLC